MRSLRFLGGLVSAHHVLRALKSTWTSIEGRRLSLLALSSPDNTPSTKAAAAVTGFIFKWTGPNKMAITIAAYENEVRNS